MRQSVRMDRAAAHGLRRSRTLENRTHTREADLAAARRAALRDRRIGSALEGYGPQRRSAAASARAVGQGDHRALAVEVDPAQRREGASARSVAVLHTAR
jgi:hypothetical protein